MDEVSRGDADVEFAEDQDLLQQTLLLLGAAVEAHALRTHGGLSEQETNHELSTRALRARPERDHIPAGDTLGQTAGDSLGQTFNVGSQRRNSLIQLCMT